MFLRRLSVVLVDLVILAKGDMKKKKRIHRHVFMLNEDEERAFQRYLTKYRVENQSNFIRKVLITNILQRFEEDHPTLF